MIPTLAVFFELQLSLVCLIIVLSSLTTLSSLSYSVNRCQ